MTGSTLQTSTLSTPWYLCLAGDLVDRNTGPSANTAFHITYALPVAKQIDQCAKHCIEDKIAKLSKGLHYYALGPKTVGHTYCT